MKVNHSLSLKLVFAKASYIVLAIAIFVGLLIMLSILSDFIFTKPYLLFYVPQYAFVNFVLIVAVSALSGLVVSMSIYTIRMVRTNTKKAGTAFFGSIIGASAGACSCGSLGFAMISTFGAAGSTATAFLTNYEIPLRLVAIGILVYTYFIMAKGLTMECKINRKLYEQGST